MIDCFVTLAGSIYLFYRFYRIRMLRLLFAAFFALALQLHSWPFFLPITVSLGCIGLISCGMCLYAYYRKKEKSFILFSVIFLFFSIAFFT
jgi:hypothetical protein